MRFISTRAILSGRMTSLRYGVAVLSILLALIPALLLPGVIESRLVVFAVAIMVSAWYGGWKPGLVATVFAVTVSAYFSVTAARVPADYGRATAHLALFVAVALLICWFNAALRSAQQGMLRSESNFRSLVTNAPYGVCRCDSAGTLLNVNPAMNKILGYASSFELEGSNLANLYADSHQWFTLVDQFRSMQQFQGVMAEWLRKDGSWVELRLSGRAIPNEDSTVFFELFIEDVTERRALEQQLRQAQKMEAVGRLAGGIAHDFNNLLTVISGYCEFVLERVAGERPLRTPVQEIANAAERATGLTRQLLAFSRKQMLAPKVLDLNAIVTENLRMLTRMIGEDIQLLMVSGAEIGAVRADPGQIEQVIMNLAVNARDAMPNGGKLMIETANVSFDEDHARLQPPMRAGEYVMLAISDTGLGMDEQTKSRIFEPFFTTKGAKGTGLGLSTVYGVVEQSGGYIAVDSEQGKGTCFKIYLPRVRATTQMMAVKLAAGSESEQVLETILLVEDEPHVRQLTREYLEKQGYSVLEAAKGTTAMEIVKTYARPIHLLLTDIIMPEMNGRELATRISALRPEIKVLYMSGYTEDAVSHGEKPEEEVKLLEKPFPLTSLKQRLREVLSSAPTQPAPSSGVARTASLPARAQRFNLQVPLKYRQVGEGDWHAGSTENISRSGVLFRAEDLVPVRSQLEINLVLPWQIAGFSATEVICRGEVVRALPPDQFTVRPALAAKILQYHFQHGPRHAEA